MVDKKAGTNSSIVRLVDSLSDELPYPDGFDAMCAGCRNLNYMYGPDDSELADHIRHGHRDPDMDAEPLPDTVTFDKRIEAISYSLTEYGLLYSADNPAPHSTKNK